jgi:BirA family biotin operon repressor/biotin-[acetyl-CoA-carboxylase] ligase
MDIVKVDATESTNGFLKEISLENKLRNFTVVITDKQTKGRGQMHTVWQSEDGKNLTFSIIVFFENLKIVNHFYISKVVSLAIREVVSKYVSAKILIKWPNDILAVNQKICGVLIENSIKSGVINQSIIGIGLNVNQLLFAGLPNATSIKKIIGVDVDLEEVLKDLITAIKKYMIFLNEGNTEFIDKQYLQYLYRLDIPSMFKDRSGNFMGKIIGVTKEGMLQVALENEDVKEFSLKEISFLS